MCLCVSEWRIVWRRVSRAGTEGGPPSSLCSSVDKHTRSFEPRINLLLSGRQPPHHLESWPEGTVERGAARWGRLDSAGTAGLPERGSVRADTRSVVLRYLQEVGYTDTILDVKSQRVRALLGLTGDQPSETRPEPMVNGTEPSSLKDSGVVRYRTSVAHLIHSNVRRESGLVRSSKPDMSDSATVLEAFKFIESAAAEFSDEDEDSEGRTLLDLAAVRTHTQQRHRRRRGPRSNLPLFQADGEEETVVHAVVHDL